MSEIPTFESFEALRMKVGTVERAELNSGARDPAYKVWIDVGEDDPVQSSAKVTDLYDVDDIIGRQVVVVTGFAPMRVGGFRSDVLIIGALTDAGVVLIAPDQPVPPGAVIA